MTAPTAVEINSQWGNEEASPNGFEEVSEAEANSTALTEPTHHSLPLPEPRKPYVGRSDVTKRRFLIWGSAFLLIVGVVGALVGGFLAGERREEGTGGSSTSAAAEIGGLGGGEDSDKAAESGRYRTRRMTEQYRYERTREKTKQRRRIGGSGEFQLKQVFGK